MIIQSTSKEEEEEEPTHAHNGVAFLMLESTSCCAHDLQHCFLTSCMSSQSPASAHKRHLSKLSDLDWFELFPVSRTSRTSPINPVLVLMSEVTEEKSPIRLCLKASHRNG